MIMSENKNKRFCEDLEYRIYRIKHLGKKYGWKLLSDIDGLIFGNNEAILKIDAVNLIVETDLIHPKKGETKIRRQGNFTQNLIERIFRNPRAHMPPEIDSQYVSE